MDHIQRELAQLEPWGKNMKKQAKNGQHFGLSTSKEKCTVAKNRCAVLDWITVHIIKSQQLDYLDS